MRQSEELKMPKGKTSAGKRIRMVHPNYASEAHPLENDVPAWEKAGWRVVPETSPSGDDDNAR